jgi:hypothetical protein
MNAQGAESRHRVPWRCRLFGHKLWDTMMNRPAPDGYVPSAEGGMRAEFPCRRCSYVWRPGR